MIPAMAGDYRRIRFASPGEVLDEVDRLRQGGYTRHGNWTLGQVCHHCAGLIEMSRRGFPEMKVPLAIRLSRPLVRWLMLGNAWMPRGMPTLPILEPGVIGGDDAGIERLRREIEAFERHAGPMAASPLLGPLTREQWERIHLIHTAHHLGFLSPATTEPPSPGATVGREAGGGAAAG